MLSRDEEARLESCLCVDLLHNLASDLAGCRHQPLAQLVLMAAFQNVWIRPEPLRRLRHLPFDWFQGLSTKQEPAQFLQSDSSRETAGIAWQIRARKRL
jgi:hypothetical protein